MAFYGQLTGNVGRDPELKYLDDGKIVANFTVAVRQNKRNGVAPPARWVKVAIWGKPAEYVGNYVQKGDAVFMVGRVEAPEMHTNRQGEIALAERFTAENIEKWGETIPRPPAPVPAEAAPTPVAAPVPRPAPAHVAAPATAPRPQWPAQNDDPPF